MFISFDLFAIALFINSGSAKKGLAIETISACPFDNIFSAISGVFILLVVIKGTLTSPIILLVTQLKAALGTIVAIVGILDSCQPIPVFIKFTPAISSSLANCTTSSQELPPSTKSSIDNLKMIINSFPTSSLILLTISKGNFILLMYSPPHLSFLLLVLFAIN